MIGHMSGKNCMTTVKKQDGSVTSVIVIGYGCPCMQSVEKPLCVYRALHSVLVTRNGRETRLGSFSLVHAASTTLHGPNGKQHSQRL